MKRKTSAFLVLCVALSGVGISLLAFQNCSGQANSRGMGSLASNGQISRVTNAVPIGSPTVDPVSGLDVLPVPSSCLPMRATTNRDLLRPALATRNTGCIMCHAQISGDLVTDFGFDNPFFMGLDKVENHPRQKDYYGPFASKHFMWTADTWAKSSVMGNIYVPETDVTDARLLNAYTAAGNTLTGPLKLVDFLSGRFVDPTVTPSLTTLIPRSTSPDINVPGLRGKFIARKSIWIDAPQVEEIRGLINLPTAVPVFAGLGLVIVKSKPSDVLVGLGSKESTRTHKLFATNGDVMTCRGDVIIDGTVFLKNLQLATDKNGCRLYVTGTVFLQGPVNYVNGDNSTLQISSSRAIIMGMRSLKPRLSQDGATTGIVGGVRAAFTDDAEEAANAPIFNDRDSIDGLTEDAGPWRTLTDTAGNVVAYLADFDNDVWLPGPGRSGAMDSTSCPSCKNDWAGSFMRKTVSYRHLVLNAPKVYGRYYGTFTGMIVAEDVMFAIDAFSFQSDPLLSTIDLLPLVGDRIFSLSND